MTEHYPLEHVTKPVWNDQDDTIRRETLRKQYVDLLAFAARRTSGLDSFDYLTADKCSGDAKRAILEAYRVLLSEDRQRILRLLESTRAFDDSERRSIKSMREFFIEYPHAFSMLCEAGHMTGSALVVHIDSRRVLLHKHKKLQRWLQFGGHSDYETNPLLVAEREAREESSLMDLTVLSWEEDVATPLDYDMQAIPETARRPPHVHADMRFVFATENPSAVTAAYGESNQFAWLSIDEAKALVGRQDSALERLLRKAQALFEAGTPPVTIDRTGSRYRR